MDELSDVQKAQIQGYFYEYQAMMTRVNWFMSLQFMPLVPSVAFFSFIAAAHTYLGPILTTWGAASVTQLAILIYYFALHEVYNHVRYIETKLKPRVAVALQWDTDSFWAWEGHLKEFGKANDPRYGDIVPAALAAIAFLAAATFAVMRSPASWWDCLGTVVAGLLLLGVVVTTRGVLKVRADFEAAA